MSWITAKRAIDYILSCESDELFDFSSVVFEFIGGEPFLEIDLIDRICDYIKIQMYTLNHHWFNSYRFAITTNGLNYHSDKVQQFIKKNIRHLSLTISIDGTRRKHDLNRVWKSSDNKLELRGSYDDVVRNIPLWLSQFVNAATKVTISSADIPYIAESVLHLFSLGIHIVHINCVFEDVWKDGDDALFEEQLFRLADSIVEKNLFNDYECSFFQRGLGRPLSKDDDYNWCGAGLMLSLDANGIFYPCTRFAKFSLRSKPSRSVGDVNRGIDKNLVRPYYHLTRSLQSTKECFECDVASGCAWCQGENYDCSESGTVFHRSMAICRMHKARVRANNYYWSRIDEIEGKAANIESRKIDNTLSLDKTIERPNTIFVLLSSRSTPFCLGGVDDVSQFEQKEVLLSIELLKIIVNKSLDEGLGLYFVYPKDRLPEEYYALISSVNHKDIVPAESSQWGDILVLRDWDKDMFLNSTGDNFLLLTKLKDFYNNVRMTDFLFCHSGRVDIVFVDESDFSDDDKQKYEKALDDLSDIVLGYWMNGRKVSVNILTDRLHLGNMSNCDAGWKSVAVAPNGKIYVCPAFYYDNENNSCGSVTSGLDIKDSLLYKLNHAPLCAKCKAYHCRRCVYLNKKKTMEVNVPSYEQCDKSRIELSATNKFYRKWIDKGNTLES